MWALVPWPRRGVRVELAQLPVDCGKGSHEKFPPDPPSWPVSHDNILSEPGPDLLPDDFDLTHHVGSDQEWESQPNGEAEDQHYRSVQDLEFDRHLESLMANSEAPSFSAVTRNLDPPDLSEPHTETVDISARVSAELLDNPPLASLKFPWERGPHKSIFSEVPHVVPAVPSMPLKASLSLAPTKDVGRADDTQASAASSGFGYRIGLFASVIRVKRDISFRDRRNDVFESALAKLTGALLLLGLAMDNDTVRACIGSRSPWTILKRAGALLLFASWCVPAGPMHEISEALAWRYVIFLRGTEAAPSRGASFLSAIRFLHFVLGLDMTVVLNSRRVSGLCEQLMLGSRWIKQAVHLTVQEVKRLHEVLDNVGQHPYDRALAARVLLALYGRCRHSDLCDIRKVDCSFDADGGFSCLAPRNP